MSAITDIVTYFYSDLYKRNAEYFLNVLLPNDGMILDHGSVSGSVGSSSDGGYWKETPQVWWDIQCNSSGNVYRLHFITRDTMFGDVTYLWCGSKYIPILDQFNEDNLRNMVDNFFLEGLDKKLMI